MVTEEITTKSDAPDSLPAGYLIAGRYKIFKCLGSGGMGAVYLAADTVLGDELVAVKVLHTGYQNDSDLMQRFLREVQLMRRVNHKNVVRTYDVGSDGQLAYFTMEYVPGTPLDRILESRSFPKRKVTSLALQIADALHAIHSAGIVHRDLKPANVILMKDGSLRITDFGVARPESSDMTAHNEILGSVCYIAPEVWLGEAATPSVDLYSLGIILYEIVTGDVPFDGGSTAELMRLHLDRTPTPPKETVPTTPVWLNNLILRLLEKSPADRFANALELADYIKLHSGTKEQKKAAGQDTGSFINELEVSSRLLTVAEEKSNSGPRTSTTAVHEKPPQAQRKKPSRKTLSVRTTRSSPLQKQRSRPSVVAIQLLRGSMFLAFAGLMLTAVFRLLNAFLPEIPLNTAELVADNPSAAETVYDLSSVIFSGVLQSLFFLIALAVPPVILVMACRGWSAVQRSFILSIGFFSIVGFLLLLSSLAPVFGKDFHTGISLASASAAAKNDLISLALLSPSVTTTTLAASDAALLASTSETVAVYRRPGLFAAQLFYLCLLWLILCRSLKAVGRRQAKLPALLTTFIGVLLILESLFLNHSSSTVWYGGGANWGIFALGAIILATAPIKRRR